MDCFWKEIILLGVLCILKDACCQTCLPEDGRDKFSSCTSCLQEAGKGCGWCLEQDPGNQRLAKGCVARSKCQGKFLDGKYEEEMQGNNNLGPSTHIKPQQMQLKLRPKIKHELNFMAKKAENAVDIYFLLDLSGSMQTYKNQLEKIPEQLVTDIQKRTTDYQFGYGAFREKPMTPMSRIEANKEYDFEHFQRLTKQTDELKQRIKQSSVSANYDTPEAGLDGLAQVILCEQEIGWRNHSTHMIVVITDAPSHIAGDGIIGGIWKPFEHKCNLVQDRKDPLKMVYNSLEHDYPSLSEINYLLEKHQKTVLFGTPITVLPLYQQMVSEEVIYRAAAGDIGTSGEGLRALVADVYNKIEGSLQISAINFRPRNVANGVKIKFTGNCQNKVETAHDLTCKKINVREQISVTAEIELDQSVCKSPFSFEIHIFGQSHSNMVVKVNPICECEDCPRENNHAPCNVNGDSDATKVCGACQCVNNQGEFCQCSKEGGLELDQLTSQCSSGKGKECSGHGSCQCGTCRCSPPYIGKYCGCNSKEIDCGEGEGRGVPQCEQKQSEDSGKLSCRCLNGWSRPEEKCTCSDRTDRCKDPLTQLICNDNGKCECNKCECNGKEGNFCQRLKGKGEDKATCARLAPCILLDIYEFDDTVEESYKQDWRSRCNDKTRYSCFVVLNNTRSSSEGNDDDMPDINDETNTDKDSVNRNCPTDSAVVLGGLKKCSIQQEFATCYIDVRHDALGGLNDYTLNNYWKKKNMYIIYDQEGNPVIQCPEKIDMTLLMGSAGGAGLFLFLIGFLSFCIVINLRDRREYKRFIAEQEEVWGKGNVKGNKLHKEKSSMRQSIKNRMSRVSFKT